MVNKISKLLIMILCVSCIAFCNVSAKQPQQEQTINNVISEILVDTPDIEIPQNFQSIAFKTISKSETIEGTTKKNEFNGVRALQELFGYEKQKFDTTFIYLSENKPLVVKAKTTWYVVNQNNGRKLYRLYYGKTPVTQAMRENDLLFIAKVDSERLFIIVANNKSSAKNKLLAAFNVEKPAEKLVSTTTIKPAESWYRIFFTPGTDCEDNIIARINKAKTIDIAVYSITNDKIAESIIKAHKRGAKVRVITDRQQYESGKYSKVRMLANAGIPVRINPLSEEKGAKYKIEHNKFAIFDGKEMELGSYNWTYNATNCNSESCMFFKQTNNEFTTRYEYLWNLYKDNKVNSL